MPIPSPSGKQDRKGFISNCMGNPTMNKEFPDAEQRAAVCYNKWRKAEGVTEIDFTEQIQYLKSRKGKEALEKAQKKYDKAHPEKRKKQKRDYNRRERKKNPDIWK
ncbi:hypothetical protein CL634_06065 [bacterium]|nr:hypothetical protein [bacterium]